MSYKHFVFFTLFFSLLVALGYTPRLVLAQEEPPVVSAETAEETLPDDGIRYHWERFRFGLRRAFVFNAEKKAALYEEQLARLERKSDACAEIGNAECLERIQQRTQALEQRAELYMEKREALKEKHLERLAEWRKQHAERLEKLKARASERQENRTEFQAIRKEQRQEMRQNVKENIEQRKENVDERRDSIQEKREKLIELRSQNVKNKLEATEQRVEERNKVLRQKAAE